MYWDWRVMVMAETPEELLRELRGRILIDIRETERGIEFMTADGTIFVLPYAKGGEDDE